ncbi:MBL fold metallo-hydrolase [Chengkuizengella axinellae]|uniref:MBL fold metallo-hydrolase n=1 Tax=Chengkuizengella axinellae TaxID=3064388 RepID=A0ABT9IXK6_9BACL|nr:MBL fold metallo-hydrolase [Chengkuizengella sp. 2205SS18-9]MDP5274105.1 MBL fold metallo-hydrolase [Chengkuizengella sp. 2205SS18-9]
MKFVELMKSMSLLLVISSILTMLTGCNITVNSSKTLATLEYLGHSSVKIITAEGKVVYIDPWAGDNYDQPADIILVTHFHYDHSDIEKVETKKSTIYIDPDYNFKENEIKSGFPGHSIEVEGIKIHAVAAYNEFHEKEESFGYILEIGDVLLYHAGDTSMIDEMKELSDLNLTYALLPIDGVYNMGPEEAVKVAKKLNAKKVIPISTGEDGFYNEDTIRMFKAENKEVLKPGDKIELISD